MSVRPHGRQDVASCNAPAWCQPAAPRGTCLSPAASFDSLQRGNHGLDPTFYNCCAGTTNSPKTEGQVCIQGKISGEGEHARQAALPAAVTPFLARPAGLASTKVMRQTEVPGTGAAL